MGILVTVPAVSVIWHQFKGKTKPLIRKTKLQIHVYIFPLGTYRALYEPLYEAVTLTHEDT